MCCMMVGIRHSLYEKSGTELVKMVGTGCEQARIVVEL